jgi:hypothetical protein
MIEYMSTQIIRSHFDEMVEWRALGLTWKEIASQLTRDGTPPSTSLVVSTCNDELRLRSSPSRIAAVRWAIDNERAIADLRNRGYGWTTTTGLLPPVATKAGCIPELDVLVAEYNVLTALAKSTSTKRDQELILKWIERKGLKTFTTRDVMISNHKRFSTSDTTQATLRALVDQGYIRVGEHAPALNNGRSRFPFWEVISHASEATSPAPHPRVGENSAN